MINVDTTQLHYVYNRKIIKYAHIDLGTKCLLECPMCPRTEHPEIIEFSKRTYGEVKIKDFKKVLSYAEHITFCGNISDPIYHPKMLDFLEMTIKYPKHRNVYIHTNGWGRKQKWWDRAFDLSKNKVKWTFALDGLPHESHKYRVNQNGEEVWEIMKYAKSLGVQIIWQFIPFKYNENSIDEAVKLAKEYNIPIKLRRSSRFADRHEHLDLKPTAEVLWLDKLEFLQKNSKDRKLKPPKEKIQIGKTSFKTEKSLYKELKPT